MVFKANWHHWIPLKYDLLDKRLIFAPPTPWVVAKQATMLVPFLIIAFWAHYNPTYWHLRVDMATQTDHIYHHNDSHRFVCHG